MKDQACQATTAALATTWPDVISHAIVAVALLVWGWMLIRFWSHLIFKK